MLSRTTITCFSYSLSCHFSSLTHPPLRNAVVFPKLLSSNNRTENPLWRITSYSTGTGITAKEEKGIFCNKIPNISSLEIHPEDDPFVRAGLRRELMPKHVAGILDGNRRWAKAHGKELDYTTFFQGYMALADLCIKWGIPTLSCFVFSTENWKCPKEANDLLFQQFETQLKESLESCMRQGIRVFVIGDKTKLPKSLQEVIKQVEGATKTNTKFELIFAVNYGGKWDITQAIQSMSKKVEDGQIECEEIDMNLLEQQLSTQMLGNPDPDLMIRTGGNQRVSNFLVWQMYHTEFYFTDAYGPDFGEDHFIDALRWFQQCDRLFGK